jgi:hypothetical protein
MVLLESGTMPSEQRRKGFIKLPVLTRQGTPGDPKSHGFFVRGGVEFEIRICDPNPTYYLWLTTEECDLFTDALPIRVAGSCPGAVQSIFND